MPTESFELLTQKEAAALLRLSVTGLQRLNRLGEGPPKLRIGDRTTTYPKAELIAWAKARTVRERPHPLSRPLPPEEIRAADAARKRRAKEQRERARVASASDRQEVAVQVSPES